MAWIWQGHGVPARVSARLPPFLSARKWQRDSWLTRNKFDNFQENLIVYFVCMCVRVLSNRHLEVRVNNSWEDYWKKQWSRADLQLARRTFVKIKEWEKEMTTENNIDILNNETYLCMSGGYLRLNALTRLTVCPCVLCVTLQVCGCVSGETWAPFSHDIRNINGFIC